MNGVKQDESNAWSVDESVGRLISDGSDGRLDIDVPIEEKDDAKALGAKWDPELKCWHISASDYQGGITRWSPKTTYRTPPSIGAALRMARYILQKHFLGTGVDAITNLEIANRAAAAYQRKLLRAFRRGERQFAEEKIGRATCRARV